MSLQQCVKLTSQQDQLAEEVAVVVDSEGAVKIIFSRCFSLERDTKQLLMTRINIETSTFKN